MTSFPENFNDTVVVAYEEFPLLMPTWGYVVSAFVLFLIGFFGFFLNLLVILLMFKDRQLWTPLNIILFNLVCSDFSVSVLGNPLTLVSALFHRWIFGQTMCMMYGFFMALLGITSITTLTVISFERYMMVTRPLRTRHLSAKGAVLAIAFIWLYALALTTPPLMGWGNYVSEAANISCSVNWHEQSLNTLTYILFLFAMGQIVPLGVITFSYVNIIRTMKRNSQRLGRVSRAEARATAMVFIMIISFTVAWTPYSIFALLEQFGTKGIISPGAGVIPALVAKSSICYDPLIYVGMNTQFRQSIKRIFGIHTKGRNSREEKGFNNTMILSANRFSTFNEVTFRCNSSDISATPRRIRNGGSFDEQSDVTNADTSKTHKVSELSTIQENKTVSDAERSGETVYDEDSSSNKKLDFFGESCKKVRENSPILTIIDSERLHFSRNSQRRNSAAAKDILINVYGNQNYEGETSECEHFKQATSFKERHSFRKPKLMKHSYSLDLGTVEHDNKKRKYSIETKLENFIQPKGFFKDSFVGKLFDTDSKKRRDNFKSYLCKVDTKEELNENL